MSAKTIDAKLLSKMFLAGAYNLESKKDIINELNVFPVPDGDTGTNMTLTIMSAAKDIANLENPDMATLCKAMSSGSLKGARGNSGVILSQLLRGFTKVIKTETELNVAILSAGFDKAVETAYKAVMKPKEGTILTVAKGIAEIAHTMFQNQEEDLEVFLQKCLAHGYEVLAQTPEMLPVLKEAGVVDSGGQGLMELLQGAVDTFMGKEVVFQMPEEEGNGLSLTCEAEAEEEKYEYSLSYKILVSKNYTAKNRSDYKFYLESLSEIRELSMQEDTKILKVNVLTNDPGLVMQKGLKFGSLIDICVKNEKVQAPTGEEKVEAAAPIVSQPVLSKPYGFVSVSVGEGLGEIFRNLGVDQVIEGGQTMNPSTEDLLNAIQQVPAETVYVLPNNKNIVMAANQARDLTEDKKVIVIPTKTVPQGISALIGFVPDLTPEENEASMSEAAGMVATGQVTYAVRDTVIDGVEIHQDDYMGIGDAGILSCGKDMTEVVKEMICKMVQEETELLSIYYGEEITEDTASQLSASLTELYPQLDIELQYGGQPVYYYIISAE